MSLIEVLSELTFACIFDHLQTFTDRSTHPTIALTASFTAFTTTTYTPLLKYKMGHKSGGLTLSGTVVVAALSAGGLMALNPIFAAHAFVLLSKYSVLQGASMAWTGCFYSWLDSMIRKRARMTREEEILIMENLEEYFLYDTSEFNLVTPFALYYPSMSAVQPLHKPHWRRCDPDQGELAKRLP